MSKTGKLGKWQGAGLLATTLLGTSVFILPQMTIAIAGQHAVWAWVLLTVFILPIALVFAKLSSLYPHASGPANFAELAFGKTLGTAIGLIFLLVVPIGAPAALIMTFQFVATLIDVSDTLGLLIQLSFLLVIYLLNIRGVSLSANVQLALTIVIALLVLVLCLVYYLSTVGLLELQIQQTPPNLVVAGITPIFSAIALAFWSFLGIEAMAHLSSEFNDPKKDFVPAIIMGTVIVGVIYIGCTFLIVQVDSHSTIKMVDVFNHLIGGYGHLVICSIGILGGIASVNVYTASCAKLIHSFSHQNVLPKVYQQQNKYGVAHTALINVVMVMATVLIVSHFFKLDLDLLVGLCNGVFVMIYLCSMLAAFKLLSQKYYLLSLISVLVCFVLALSLGWKMAYALVLLALLAPIIRYRHRKLRFAQA